MIIFNLTFSVIQSSGLNDKSVQIQEFDYLYAGYVFTGCVTIVNVYLMYFVYIFNEKVRGDRHAKKRVLAEKDKVKRERVEREEFERIRQNRKITDL